jgi:serine/threonine protein kinase
LIRPFNGAITEETVINEVRAIEKLCDGSHPNIITVFRHGLLRPNHAIYFIDMEKCTANLDEYVRGKRVEGINDWQQLQIDDKLDYLIGSILNDVVNGLAVIHRHDEVHRDISPLNSKSI